MKFWCAGTQPFLYGRSPSMRREWIEIAENRTEQKLLRAVSLHAEGVD